MTLVEVLVATVILGVGVTALLSAATLATRNQRRSETRLQALYMAQEKLAEVEQVGAHVYLLSRPSEGTEKLGEQSYSWEVQIEQQQLGALFTVQVDVTWKGTGEGSVRLASLLNDYEANAAMPGQQQENRTPGAMPQGGGT